MKDIYCCSECGIYMTIKPIPPPDRPYTPTPKGFIPECCPFCGETSTFMEYTEVDE